MMDQNKKDLLMEQEDSHKQQKQGTTEKNCAKLRIGDKSKDSQVEIVDEDRLCYLVRAESRGAYGIRTISKQLLQEFVDYFKTYPANTANDARSELCGKTNMDKFEYGYAATLTKLAKMVLHSDTECIHSPIEKQYTSTDQGINPPLRPHLTAIKSKPFLLLAGISGTGKSRIVRELARACWEKGEAEYRAQKPRNFEMVQVKPNWHDSSELIGYVSRVSGKAEFVAGDFLKFVARAWAETDKPYFLCLDEMNLAPVEQYFAEYLSVVESRKRGEDGTVATDPILRKEDAEWYFNLTAAITSDEEVRARFNKDGICIPQNLIVVGTVNMDETTFSFSRKVLDRAMTIEMNEVDLRGGLTERHESIEKIGENELIGTAVEGVDVYDDYKDVCDTALGYLQKINDVLGGTPFKVAYRTRNEFLLYVVNNLPYNKDEEGNELPQGFVVARALDEITSMKILSRIEGDDSKVTDRLLDMLSQTITEGLNEITDEDHKVESVSVAKLSEMKRRLQSGYTSFWS